MWMWWSIVFMILRYVFVALLLTYLTNVFVKRKDIHTDIKGYVLEWRVDTYKNIHRWLMQFKSVIAAPSQDEQHYQGLLSDAKFEIGYQGMEYASFFDTPERLKQFSIEFNRMFDKDRPFIDDGLKHTLYDFQCWMNNVFVFLNAFIRTEKDERWNRNDEEINNCCKLACKVLGIALQKDVNYYFDKIDDLLRDRLRYIKISGKYTETDKEQDIEKFRIYNRSQLCRNSFGVFTIFSLIHFENLLVKDPSTIKDKELFVGLINEYKECFSKNLSER